jgi:hypothetical protein
MTRIEREAIFSKEALSIEDVEKLFGVEYDTAAKIIRDIKTKITVGDGKKLRLSVQGKLHMQDYLDYVGVSVDRYSIKQGEELYAAN